MKGYVGETEILMQRTIDFRHVLYSGLHLQFVAMLLRPSEELGGEILLGTDQFFKIETGKGRLLLGGITHKIKAGDIVIVPAGVHHNLICVGKKPLKFFTIYGPSHHIDQLAQATRVKAGLSDARFDGVSTEHAAPIVLL
jgi:mannose-6-phosphate isomerase-like protein (cupin superfamily)